MMRSEPVPPAKVKLALDREEIADGVATAGGCLATVMIVSSCVMAMMTVVFVADVAGLRPEIWLGGVCYALASWLSISALIATAILRKRRAMQDDGGTPISAVVRGGLIAMCAQLVASVLALLVYFGMAPSPSQFGPEGETVLAWLTFGAVTALAVFAAATNAIRWITS